MTGHWDGGVCTWNYKNPKKPDERQVPHSTGHAGSKKDRGNGKNQLERVNGMFVFDFCFLSCYHFYFPCLSLLPAHRLIS